MNLWAHQELGLIELDAAIESGETRVCVTSPTGGGKSRMLFEHLRQGHRSTVYTDRVMLREQLSKNMHAAGIEHGIIASGVEPSLADVQLAMTQTVVSRCVKGVRSVHPSKRVYWDEVHKQGGDGSLEVRALHGDHIDIGLTATPLGIGHCYDKLIVAGTNSELRECGALVLAHHYGPDEPDTKWVGQVKVDAGECGIPTSKREQFAHRVFGRVVDNFRDINPEEKATLLFAPGVAESMWFAQELCRNEIPAAHIDGENVWLDGEVMAKTQELVDEIEERLRYGELSIVCNRFVLREGIDWPFVEHGILATVFGSLTSYLQAGGRFLRASEGKTHCTIQDHGGNWHRHGSLNSDREWDLGYTDRIVAGLRDKRLREKKEREPIVCPKCHAIRLGGPKCPKCGHQHNSRVRSVLQHDGTLREMSGEIYRARRTAKHTQNIEKSWVSRVQATRRSKKESVRDRTFAQLEVSFARDNNWCYPPRTLPCMPVNEADWFRPVREVTETT